MIRNSLYCLVLFSVCWGLLGCATAESSDSPAVAAAPVAATTQLAPGEADPLQRDELYTFNAIGKRDPFCDPYRDLEVLGPKSTLQPLEHFDLDQLKLVAVVVGTAAPRAMIEDPSGQGHVVKIGALAGKHSGQVKHIRPDGIIVREEYRDHMGRRIEHLIALRLPVAKEQEL